MPDTVFHLRAVDTAARAARARHDRQRRGLDEAAFARPVRVRVCRATAPRARGRRLDRRGLHWQAVLVLRRRRHRRVPRDLAGDRGRGQPGRPRALCADCRAAVSHRRRDQRGLPRGRARARAPLHCPHGREHGAASRLPRGVPRPLPRVGRDPGDTAADRAAGGGSADRREPTAPEPPADGRRMR